MRLECDGEERASRCSVCGGGGAPARRMWRRVRGLAVLCVAVAVCLGHRTKAVVPPRAVKGGNKLHRVKCALHHVKGGDHRPPRTHAPPRPQFTHLVHTQHSDETLTKRGEPNNSARGVRRRRAIKVGELEREARGDERALRARARRVRLELVDDRRDPLDERWWAVPS